MSAYLAAFVSGLAGSMHCVAMCGGLAATAGSRPSGAAAWHLGRLSTYALLGAVAGTVGKILPGPAWIPGAVATVLLCWFALAIAGLVPEPRIRIPGIGRAGATLANREGLGWRYLFGMTTGLLPCGLVYAALALPVALGHPLAGALAMVAFGLGTVPALATLSVALQRVLRSGIWARRAVAAVILAMGLWTVAMRVKKGGHAGHAGQAPADTTMVEHGRH
ncbi:MAG TPA: sulfite exporter TauE/SafE family protein [Gemmatimonadales bacterium]|nr:sulfite exporter TauE/SafE family protein [Gemmatimonadales bacterium]